MLLGVISRNQISETNDNCREDARRIINTNCFHISFEGDKDVDYYYNGEVFFLIDGYIISDCVARTRDIEILAELYEKKGIELVQNISGKYCIVICDDRKKTIYFVSDRFGERKISYSLADGKLYFGRNTQCVAKKSGNTNIRSQSLGMYFSYNYICSPNTVFENVYKGFPGHYVKFCDGKIEDIPYWTPEAPRYSTIGYSNYEHAIVDEIWNSLRGRFEKTNCRKPALFLSGGIDSTVLCKILSENHVPTIAYTARFLGGTKNQDESETAKQISSYYGISHRIIDIDPEQLREHVLAVLKSADEPMANRTYATAAILMENAVSECDCVVTGDGGDELFMGYPQYQRLDQAQRINTLLAPLQFTLSEKVLHKILPQKVVSILYNSKHFPPEQLFSYNSVMIAQRAVLNCQQDLSYKVPERLMDKRWYSRKNYIDLVYGTQAAIRKWNDNADVAGLYHFSPILDEKVVGIAKSIPIRFLMDKKNNKILMRDIISKDIPEISRLPKHGFDVPVIQWLHSAFKEELDYYTSKSYIERQGLFDYEAINKLKKQFESGSVDYTNNADTFMWDYYAFQCWYSNWEII